MAAKPKPPKRNCNSCKWGEVNPSAPLPFGPRGDQTHELECMHPDGDGPDDDEGAGSPVYEWANENLLEGWCLKKADGCPGYEASG